MNKNKEESQKDRRNLLNQKRKIKEEEEVRGERRNCRFLNVFPNKFCQNHDESFKALKSSSPEEKIF